MMEEGRCERVFYTVRFSRRQGDCGALVDDCRSRRMASAGNEVWVNMYV